MVEIGDMEGKGQKTRRENALAGSSIRLMVPATQAASRRMMNSKPSFEIRVTYSDWGEGMVILWVKWESKIRVLYFGLDFGSL